MVNLNILNRKRLAVQGTSREGLVAPLREARMIKIISLIILNRKRLARE